MNSPRIVHVITESIPFGGAQRNTLLTLKGLVRDGYRAELVCGAGGPLIREADGLGVPVHVIPDLIRSINPIKDSKVLLGLYNLFRTRKYDIVHTHSTKAGLLGRMAARWAGTPLIIHTVHGVPFEMNGGLKSRCYLAAERLVGSVTHCLICVGEVLRQEVAAWAIVSDDKLRTIYSGIDFRQHVAQTQPSQMKQRLGLENAWPIVGCIGRLSEQKAQHYLLEAVGHLKERYPRVMLMLIGDGELRPLLEKQTADHGLAPHVRLLGERDDVPDLLNIFDIYAMSSLWEGVGRALSEAMYWQLPIVATPVNGVKELIQHEETGLLVPPRDPMALAAAMDRLLCDLDFARRLGSRAHEKAVELMNGERMIRAIEDVYRELMHKRGVKADVDSPAARVG